MAILYISHRLSDLQRVADRALVLRDGRLVGEFAAPLDLAAAVESMLSENKSVPFFFSLRVRKIKLAPMIRENQRPESIL